MQKPDSNPEKTVLELLRRGDRAQIKELYRHAYPPCASLIIKNSGTEEDARDIFQESLIVLYNNIRNADFELNCNIKTYLFSVARNLWLKKLNRRKKGGLSLVIDDPDREYVMFQEDELPQKREREHQHEHVSNLLNQSKDDCRELLISYYFKKIPLKEIGSQMGYSDSFVKVKKNRCMEALKKKVRETYKPIIE